MSLEQVGLSLLRRLDPERAHGLALRALRTGLAPLPAAPAAASTAPPRGRLPVARATE